jgi:hypothetical protein
VALVAVRAWRSLWPQGRRVALRSDSLATLNALAKVSSPSNGLNLVIQDIDQEEAGHAWGFESLTHIPGISNAWADSLSRRWVPEATAVPRMLLDVDQVTCDRRAPSWYLTSSLSEPRRARALALRRVKR